MNRTQQLQKAKFYMEMMACSMDPTTQEFVEDTILQKKEVKEMLDFISSILDEMLNSEEDYNDKYHKKVDFKPELIDLNKVELSESPIDLKNFVKRVNSLVDSKVMQRLKGKKITEWLIESGILYNKKVSVVKEINVVSTTEKAEEYGVLINNTIDEETGEIDEGFLLSKKAQEYILDNLQTILADKYKKFLDLPEEKREGISRGNSYWTEFEEEKLIEEYSVQKLPVYEIAKSHGRSRGSIYGRLKKLNLIK